MRHGPRRCARWSAPPVVPLRQAQSTRSRRHAVPSRNNASTAEPPGRAPRRLTPPSSLPSPAPLVLTRTTAAGSSSRRSDQHPSPVSMASRGGSAGRVQACEGGSIEGERSDLRSLVLLDRQLTALAAVAPAPNAVSSLLRGNAGPDAAAHPVVIHAGRIIPRGVVRLRQCHDSLGAWRWGSASGSGYGYTWHARKMETTRSRRTRRLSVRYSSHRVRPRAHVLRSGHPHRRSLPLHRRPSAHG